MKKLIAVFGIMAACFIGMRLARAATEIESINADFAHKTAQVVYYKGDFVLQNSILTNGDKVEVNAFEPTGLVHNIPISGQDFTTIFGGLIAQSALNMDAVTNATLGQTGVYIAGTDENQVNYWANGTY